MGTAFVRARGEYGSFAVTTTKDGALALDGLPPGRYRVQALPVNRAGRGEAVELQAGRAWAVKPP